MKADPQRLLILGGGSDIAASFVDACAASSLERVVLAGRAGGSVDRSATAIAAAHPKLDVEVVGFDASATDLHETAVQAVDERYGPFDTVLVAFGQLGAPFTLDIAPAEAVALADVNFSAAVGACIASLNILRGEPNARLLVMSSIAAVRPRVGNIVYGAAKAGLDAFAREITAPAADLGVDVVVIRPGFVHTQMTEGLEPAPFATTADVVATDMLNGIRKGKSVIHSPAVLAPVGGVLKNLPAPVWRKVSDR